MCDMRCAMCDGDRRAGWCLPRCRSRPCQGGACRRWRSLSAADRGELLQCMDVRPNQIGSQQFGQVKGNQITLPSMLSPPTRVARTTAESGVVVGAGGGGSRCCFKLPLPWLSKVVEEGWRAVGLRGAALSPPCPCGRPGAPTGIPGARLGKDFPVLGQGCVCVSHTPKTESGMVWLCTLPGPSRIAHYK
eukprot:SAG31_NODE_1752_length_7351_cov_29.035852_8_plen_190_part_00